MKQVVMPFDGKVIETVTGPDGKPWISVRSVCQAIGVDVENQRRRIQTDERFNRGAITTVAEDGKNREMFCIPLEQLNGWLFSIQPNRVREDIRPNLIRYQQECFQVLYNYFMPNGVQDLQPFMDRFDRIESKIDYMAGLDFTVFGDDAPAIKRELECLASREGKSVLEIWGEVRRDCDVSSYKKITRKILNYLKIRNNTGGLTIIKEGSK